MQHLNIKIFARKADGFAASEAIPVFHRWIQNRSCPELLIDVADYSHVPAGPGVLLIGREANYGLDSTRNRLGLLYSRKAAVEGDSMRQALDAARAACDRLEQEPELQGKLVFDRDEVEVTLNDRLLHPNTEATWQAVKPELTRFFDGVFGAGHYALGREGEPRERLRVSVRPLGTVWRPG